MSENSKYSFEMPRRNLISRLARVVIWIKGFFAATNTPKQNKAVFLKRLGIPALKSLSHKERFIVNSFIDNNLYNIYWYSKRIRKEQRKLNRYYLYTLAILLGVPLFIFVSTSSIMIEEGEGLLNQLVAERELSTIITVVVTSLLTLHAFISGWMDQRKIVVEFSKASVELKKLYYQIETLHFDSAANGSIGFEGQNDGQKLSDGFLNALSDGIVLSQRVVDNETNNYYELRAQPSFDIRSIWEGSASTAKRTLNLFKSDKFDPDKTEKKALTLSEKAESTKGKIETKKDFLEQSALKINQSRKALEKLSLKLDDIEHLQLSNKPLTDKQNELYFTYQEQFRLLDEETDLLEEEYERVGLEVKLLESRLGEIIEVL